MFSQAEFELLAQILPGLLRPHHHLHRGDGLIVVVQLGKQRARAGDGAGDQVGEPQSHPG